MTPPPAGPLDEAPDVDHETARSWLDDALAGLPMGAWDSEVLSQIGLMEPAGVAAVASWLRRAWDAGMAAGRAERAAEVKALEALAGTQMEREGLR